MRKQDIEDLSIGTMVVTILVILIGLIVITLLFISMGWVRPALLDLQREGNQRSQQFIDTTVNRLFQLSRKYDDLEADIQRLSKDEDNAEVVKGMLARQESLLDEMEQEANSIPIDEIPKKIKNLLAEKGRLN